MAGSKSNLDNCDSFNQLSYYLDKIDKSEEKMASSYSSNLVDFTTIESNMFNVFTMYLKLTQKIGISSSLMSEVDNFTLTVYVLGGLTDEKLNNIKTFLNDKLKQADEGNQWEEFKVAADEVCRAENCPMISNRFYTKGEKGNKATKRNVSHYFSSTVLC